MALSAWRREVSRVMHPLSLGRFLVLGLLTVFALVSAREADAEPTLPPGFNETVVFSSLIHPTALAFAPTVASSSPRSAASSRYSTV